MLTKLTYFRSNAPGEANKSTDFSLFSSTLYHDTVHYASSKTNDCIISISKVYYKHSTLFDIETLYFHKQHI